jgi:hypothetical protein
MYRNKKYFSLPPHPTPNDSTIKLRVEEVRKGNTIPRNR